MKFSVGLSKKDARFADVIIANKQHIHEVYFSWGDFADGRGNISSDSDKTLWELMSEQNKALQKLSDEGLCFNILFNANCYGKDSQSRTFFCKVGNTLDYVKNTYGLSSVTTTSPLIAKFVKNNFSELSVRASVNMEIGTVQGMDYLSEYFDSFYVKRELNRDFDALMNLKKFADNAGKELYMLANSGCLNFCSAHIFHDNLVAHENEISGMDNAYNFGGICHEYLKDESKYERLYENTNFVRPEDIEKYEDIFVAAKLATRVSPCASLILESYIAKHCSGDILRLLEPCHSIYPYVLENTREGVKLTKINTDISFYEEEIWNIKQN